jgi:hypothetical protein
LDLISNVDKVAGYKINMQRKKLRKTLENAKNFDVYGLVELIL